VRQWIANSSHVAASDVSDDARAWASHISAFSMQEVNDIIL